MGGAGGAGVVAVGVGVAVGVSAGVRASRALDRDARCWFSVMERSAAACAAACSAAATDVMARAGWSASRVSTAAARPRQQARPATRPIRAAGALNMG